VFKDALTTGAMSFKPPAAFDSGVSLRSMKETRQCMVGRTCNPKCLTSLSMC
jgi:hypothetical protein